MIIDVIAGVLLILLTIVAIPFVALVMGHSAMRGRRQAFSGKLKPGQEPLDLDNPPFEPPEV